MRRSILILSILSIGLLFSGLFAQNRHPMHNQSNMNKAWNDSSQYNGNTYPYGWMMNGRYGMMQGNMMGMMNGTGMMGMMNGGNMNRMNFPLYSEVYPVLYRLPELQKELNLSDEQVSGLNKLRSDYQKETIDKQSEIAKLKIDLKGMLEQNADSKQVRKNLSKINNTFTDIEVDSYKTAQKMLSVLTDKQRSKWNEEDFMTYGHHARGNMMHGDHNVMFMH